ncbi:nucleoside triphosphate pyrophosphohydrolase [Inconstantimicrobium porci]|uniref:Nucleoside triphosphate pyrophosphohydrolase n=1 Tax=Inconstantimicrobium porci TaxID=2652291 RepID=A0A7X2MY74_9CLOT|nr:nucleoside triphosphate pyrophosphohydrolase [Inconstantimicrobium porci]MDD6769822.1 nucleoside triphosphate pyrophosphohydrolase [Inconstantimicrobium porci]MSR90815.1 nucleoside triphosphate pyrophosphohydrolase [Inconstantimicrobium porci]
MIKIVGLGPGSELSLTVGTINALKNCEDVYFRTKIHPTVDYIEKQGIKFETYDFEYETKQDFDSVYMSIAEDLVEKAKEKDIVYAVPGHPLVAEKSVVNLISLCEKEHIKYEILPAVSFIDAIMESLKIDPVEGLKVIDAFDMKNQIMDKRIGTIITQVYNQFIASEVKLSLLDYYNDETEIYFIRAAGIPGLESIRKIPLYELDRQEDIDYLTSVYIPKNLDNKKDIYDLVDLVEILRGENGCPWDREQTHKSVRNALIEESYEAADAIDNEDDDAMVEELGDVLFQVIFHAVIGHEDAYFDLSDIIDGVYNKMVYRHPHVFGDDKAKDTEEVLDKWNELKKKEKSLNTVTDELKAVAKALPGLTRAQKIQKKASKVGFDWDNVFGAMSKVEEELNELKEVYNGSNKARILDEVGDLIFACVNVSRFLGVDSEDAVNNTCEKFIKRFQFIEEKATEKGMKLENMSLEQMDELWESAKLTEK